MDSGDNFGMVETNYFDPTAEPEEQVKARQEEKGKVNEGIRLLEEIIDRWTKKIASYDSVSSIKVDLTDKPEVHQKRVAVCQGIIEEMTKEKEYLENLRSTYS